jgi:hypothetical protein
LEIGSLALPLTSLNPVSISSVGLTFAPKRSRKRWRIRSCVPSWKKVSLRIRTSPKSVTIFTHSGKVGIDETAFSVAACSFSFAAFASLASTESITPFSFKMSSRSRAEASAASQIVTLTAAIAALLHRIHRIEVRMSSPTLLVRTSGRSGRPPPWLFSPPAVGSACSGYVGRSPFGRRSFSVRST